MVLDRGAKLAIMGFLVGFTVISSILTIETQNGVWLTLTLLSFAAILAMSLYWFDLKSPHKRVLSTEEQMAEAKAHFKVFVVGMTFAVVLPVAPTALHEKHFS